MFLRLAASAALWVGYGFLNSANSVSFALLMGVRYLKLPEHRYERAGRVCGTQTGIKLLFGEER